MSEPSLKPDFIIYFNGKRIPGEREAEIKEINVSDNCNSPSFFKIKIADTTGEWRSNSDFSEGAEVEIKLGYKDDVETVIIGDVTGVALHFRRQMGDLYTIMGFNRLRRLCREIKTVSYTGMTDKEIIARLADEAGLTTEVENLTTERVFTTQRGCNDFEYLLELAASYDCNMLDDKLRPLLLCSGI